MISIIMHLAYFQLYSSLWNRTHLPRPPIAACSFRYSTLSISVPSRLHGGITVRYHGVPRGCKYRRDSLLSRSTCHFQSLSYQSASLTRFLLIPYSLTVVQAEYSVKKKPKLITGIPYQFVQQ